MPLYMLDTDICSYAIRGGHPKLDARLARTPADSLCLSVVSRAELLYGVERKGRPPALAALVADLLRRIASLPWDDEAARHYAEVRAALERKGQPIGNIDLMIAAHARAKDAVLITNNEREFRRVAGLKRENWVRARAS